MNKGTKVLVSILALWLIFRVAPRYIRCISKDRQFKNFGTVCLTYRDAQGGGSVTGRPGRGIWYGGREFLLSP